MPCLISHSFCVGSFCWLNGIHSTASFCEELFSCIIDIGAIARTIIQIVQCEAGIFWQFLHLESCSTVWILQWIRGSSPMYPNAVAFPLPANDEVWSHPVSAWNTGCSLALSGPRSATTYWMGMCQHDFPYRIIPPAHRWPGLDMRQLIIPTRSVSIVRNKIFVCPYFAQSAACNNCSLVSAFSWVQGDMPSRFFGGCCTTPGSPWL